MKAFLIVLLFTPFLVLGKNWVSTLEAIPDTERLVVVYQGEITPDGMFFTKMQLEWLNEYQEGERLLIISSPGGSVAGANLLIDYLKINNVEVMAAGKCASACASILLSANKISILKGAKVGVHKPYYASGKSLLNNEVFMWLKRRLEDWSNGVGADNAKYIGLKATRTHSKKMHYFSEEELKSFGVTILE